MTKIFVLMLNILFLSSCIVNVKSEDSELSQFEIAQLEYTPENVASYEYLENSVSVKIEKISEELISVKLSKSIRMPDKSYKPVNKDISLSPSDADFQDVLNFLEADFTFSLKFHPSDEDIVCALPTFHEYIKRADGSIIEIPQDLRSSYAKKHGNQKGYTSISLLNSNSPTGWSFNDDSVKKYLEAAKNLKL